MDFEIGVVGVRLARQHGFEPQLLRAAFERVERRLGLGDQLRLAFGFGHRDEAFRVRKLVLEASHGGQRRIQPLALAHQRLGVLRLVPDGGVFGLGVQLVETAEGFVPVKDASSAGRWPA